MSTATTPRLNQHQLATVNAVNEAVANYRRMQDAAHQQRKTALEVARALWQLADAVQQGTEQAQPAYLRVLADRLTAGK